jgi:SET domain-containing protein
MSDIFYVSPKVQVKRSDIHGYGVFAVEQIEKDTTIEISRLLRLGWRMMYQNDPVIRDYCWGNLGCACEQCKIHGPHSFIALGYGSLYNHADTPNTEIKFDFEKGVMTITAVREIKMGEEVLVSYGENYWKHRARSLTKIEQKV